MVDVIDINDKVLGRNATDFENENWRKLDFPCIYFWKEKRIILPEEFYNKEGPESLYWNQLGKIKHRSEPGFGDIFCMNLGVQAREFNGLLETLFEELVKQEKMTAEYPKIGDYFIRGGGIELSYLEGSDPHGRRGYSSKFYYPKLKEDAIGYAKSFESGWVKITQVVDNVLCGTTSLS